MSREIVKLLRKTSIFSFLDPNSLTKISGLFKEETYTSGHLFFRDDTVNDILYIIKQGAVKIVKTGKRGEGKLSFILRREGDFFGETALIEETSPLETAQAIKNTRVLQLSRSDFLTIVSSYPFVAFQIMKALTSRLRNSYLGLIEELGEKDEQLEKASADSKSPIDLKGKGIQYREEGVWFSDEMISGFPFSIVATREDGTIFIFNQSAEKEYGYSSEEVMGKSIDWLRGEENPSNLDKLIEEALKDKGVWNGEIIGKRKNGERFLSEATVYEIVDLQSAKPTLLWVTRDMARKPAFATEAGEMEKRLNWEETTKELADKLSDQVQLLSENLDLLTYEANQLSSPQLQVRVKTIKDVLGNLKSIISTFPSFVTEATVKRPMDLVSFMEKELLLLKPQERFKGIEFITKFDEKLPLVEIDPQKMTEILTALLNHAVLALKEVSDQEKTVVIQIRYLVPDEEVEIQVLDTGKGISEDDLPKVFQEHPTTKDQGMGFGLFSVKKAVEAHGGNIEVQSMEGAYTLFTIRFPIREQVSIQAEEPSPAMVPST
jgi:PAS domain S-box-containing protein